MTKRFLAILPAELLIIFLSYVLVTWVKSGSNSYFAANYIYGLIIFTSIWFSISLLLRKFHFDKESKSYELTRNILIANFIILASITILMYGVRSLQFSRIIVFGTIFTATVFEIIAGNIHYYVSIANGNGKHIRTRKPTRKKRLTDSEALLKAEHEIRVRDISLSEIQLKKDIIEECGKGSYKYISGKIDLLNPHNLVISTSTVFNIQYQPDHYLTGIVNLKRINDIRYINKFFEAVNRKLPPGGTFMGCVETKELRKKRILRKYLPPFNWIYYLMDFMVKRVFPKFNITKKIYFFLTRGQNRVISRPETLGRLYSCGFKVTEEDYVDKLLFFVAVKVKDPAYDLNPSYGPFIRLKRIGKNGKFLRVYKMRTMHPYAEYLQEYVHLKNDLREGGKFRDDYRISTLGRIMRMFWIDELPMLINWFRGEIRLVGVRPISEHYFNLYSKEHRRRRIRYKPGLIPPYYADLPNTLEEIEESEKRFLDAFDRHPFRTNWKYFWKAIFNIIFRRARSK